MLILLGSFLGLMILGVPVAIAMAVASLAFILISGTVPDVILAQRMIAGVESFPLLAVPFFILAGNLMNIAGVTGRIYSFAVALVGWMRGGLAQVNIIGSVIFSGMSGTAIADAAGIGTIEIKAMKDHGYPLDVAVGVTAASATLGPIIPPSLPFVIYGMMANTSIGALFLGGVIPGVVMTLFMMITVAIFARLRNWGSDAKFSWRQIGAAGLEVAVVFGFPLLAYVLVWAGLSVNVAIGLALAGLLALDYYFDFSAVMALMTPVILIGGMTLGWFTPTEAAAAAVIWSLFLGLVRYRSMTLRSLTKATFDTIETTASVLFIVTAASIFAWLLTVSQHGADPVGPHPGLHPEQMGFPGSGEHPPALHRLLPRHHRGDHHLGADPAADRAQARRRPDPFRADHDAEPDDRPAASAARHGAVRVVARGKALGRADHHGDPALAGTALRRADRDHLHP
jgi:TRAP-type C4-dicarboxylate transport system permease large subunit